MNRTNILIVDDDECYLRLVESIVTHAGITAHYALSGEEAVKILSEGDVSMMITDLNMPGINGYELSMIAKKMSPDIDIIMITGSTSPNILTLAANAGVSKVIAKPCGAGQIREIVRGNTVS